MNIQNSESQVEIKKFKKSVNQKIKCIIIDLNKLDDEINMTLQNLNNKSRKRAQLQDNQSNNKKISETKKSIKISKSDTENSDDTEIQKGKFDEEKIKIKTSRLSLKYEDPKQKIVEIDEENQDENENVNSKVSNNKNNKNFIENNEFEIKQIFLEDVNLDTSIDDLHNIKIKDQKESQQLDYNFTIESPTNSQIPIINNYSNKIKKLSQESVTELLNEKGKENDNSFNNSLIENSSQVHSQGNSQISKSNMNSEVHSQSQISKSNIDSDDEDEENEKNDTFNLNNIFSGAISTPNGAAAKETIKTTNFTRMSSQAMIGKMKLSDTQLKHQRTMIFDLNEDNRCVMMVNKEMKIVQYNKKFCQNLLFDKHELYEQEVESIIDRHQHKDSIDLIQSLIDKSLLKDCPDYKIDDSRPPSFKPDDFSESPTINEDLDQINLCIQDKSLKETTFLVSFKPQIYLNSKEEKQVNLILQMESIQKEESMFCIDPRNIIQLLFSLVIFGIIIFLIFQVPQDLAFGDETLADFNTTFDTFVTIVFTIDIFLNFFLAYEDEDGRQVFDLQMVTTNYITNSLLFDIISTVPFEQVIDQIAFNTSIIKSIKIIKIFKLIKILKVSKVLSFKNKQISKVLGEEVVMAIKRSSGFFDLMRQNLQILIGSHQQTIFYFQVKSNFLQVNPNDQTWLVDFQGIDKTDSFSIQILLLQANVKTALGLGADFLENPQEVAMQMAWMFLGLSMFGYGIGNISSQLNHSNQAEIEFNNTKLFFMEICEFQNVDPRIQSQIHADIDKWQTNLKTSSLQEKSKIITKPVMIQLETWIQQEFIDSFPLMSKLNIQIIRLMNNCIFTNQGKIKILKGSKMTEVFFVTKGKLSQIDNDMNVTNEFNQGEIFGFDKLLEWCQLKYSLDQKQLLERLDVYLSNSHNAELVGNRDYLDVLQQCKEQVRDRMTSLYKNTDHNMDMDLNNDADNIVVFNNKILISTEDLEQFSVPQSMFESMIMYDFESFLIMWRYQDSFFARISDEESFKIYQAMSKFESNSMPGIILMTSGEVFNINSAFSGEKEWAKSLIGVNIFEILKLRGKNQHIEKLDDIHNDELGYYFKFGNSTHILYIEDIWIGNIRRGIFDQSSDAEQEYNHIYNLKKCMMQVKIIQFSIEDLNQ